MPLSRHLRRLHQVPLFCQSCRSMLQYLSGP
ncbi:MAG TPA: hypothetical protein EYP04_12230 [Anaerolineae bacterium]|nr:hypothetical protein [Anaerolineae bacterium]